MVTTTLSIKGVAISSQFDYDDFYEELYYTYDNIDYIYDWLQNPHPRRGDIKIELTSPQGTKSVLLPYRNYDFINEEGYDNWPFMSVHFWGENPLGTWTLKITYKSGSGYVRMSGLKMTLYGTATVPSAVSSIPTTCHSSCARGCSGDGPEHCDSCVNYRIASNFRCVDDCPTNTYDYKKYCFGDGSIPNDGQTSNINPTTTTSNTDATSSVVIKVKQKSSTKKNSKLPLVVGITVGLLVVISASVVLTATTYVVYIKRCKTKREGFVLMTSMEQEVET